MNFEVEILPEITISMSIFVLKKEPQAREAAICMYPERVILRATNFKI
jgi:hypothetical protein